MMKLSDLYEALALNELKNLHMAEGGTIKETEKSSIVLHTNNALTRLYSRFPLKESNLYLEMRGFLTTYHLSSKYAQSNYDPAAGHSFYINDMGNPFKDDVLRVLSVYDGWARKLPLNDRHAWRSVFTPTPTTLQIQHPMEGHALNVHYQASHPRLNIASPDDPIHLPEFLHGALTAYIGYKVLSNINTQESNAKAAELLRTFESICVEVIEQDLVTTGGMTGDIRFEKNGWR